jgi:hypothetical protein
MSQSAIKSAVQSLLRGINIGDVDAQAGGTATWVRTPRRKQAYWYVSVREIRESDYTLGAMAHADHTVVIEGWMPMSFADRTSEAWDAKVDAVRDALRSSETLSGTASETGNPNVTTNDLRSIAGGGCGEIVCHHCVIEWRASEDLSYARS